MPELRARRCGGGRGRRRRSWARRCGSRRSRRRRVCRSRKGGAGGGVGRGSVAGGGAGCAAARRWAVAPRMRRGWRCRCAGAPGAGRAFGFPSGPVSSCCACATTSGEVCACDAKWRTASPSAQSWQAARDEALSWSLSPCESRAGETESRTPGSTMNCQPLGRIVASAESSAVYFDIITGCMRACSRRVQKKRSDTLAIDLELRRPGVSPGGGSICRSRRAGWRGRSAHR